MAFSKTTPILRIFDEAKAKACLRGYLSRKPDAPDAGRIRTVVASFGSTKSVSCVSRSEIDAARRAYQRRGATIDSWVRDAR